MVSFRAVLGSRLRLTAIVTVMGVGALAWRQAAPGHDADAVQVDQLSVENGPPGLPEASSYVVAPGDTLGAIAAAHGTSLDSLMALNGISDPDSLRVGDQLSITMGPPSEGPPTRLVPDSEVVYGQAYANPDDGLTSLSPTGALAAYTELVDGTIMTGPEMIRVVARDFSVGPRVILAQIEAASGWVTGQGEPSAADYPVGLEDPARAGLWRQLNWLADRLNRGYYDWKTRDSRLMFAGNGVPLAGHPELGAGAFGVQSALLAMGSAADLDRRLAEFDAAYRRLFGDPFTRDIEMLHASQVEFPDLALPWPAGEEWWFTGGPHGGWAQGSAWASLDFVPPDHERGCYVSPRWVTAVADGVVVDAGTGALALDLDGDGLRQTGPVVFYLHLAAAERTPSGTAVRTGDRLGHPSCEGGLSNATHLHMARLYDGEWLAADGVVPFRLGQWEFFPSGAAYDGSAVSSGGDRREPCECREPAVNGIR